MFCQATGFGGTVQEGRSVEDKLRAREENRDEALESAAAAREVTVSFNADVADGMPWRFIPAQRSVKVSIYLQFGNTPISNKCLKLAQLYLLPGDIISLANPAVLHLKNLLSMLGFGAGSSWGKHSSLLHSS